jgi:hypothetical protein
LLFLWNIFFHGATYRPLLLAQGERKNLDDASASRLTLDRSVTSLLVLVALCTELFVKLESTDEVILDRLA